MLEGDGQKVLKPEEYMLENSARVHGPGKLEIFIGYRPCQRKDGLKQTLRAWCLEDSRLFTHYEGDNWKIVAARLLKFEGRNVAEDGGAKRWTCVPGWCAEAEPDLVEQEPLNVRPGKDIDTTWL